MKTEKEIRETVQKHALIRATATKIFEDLKKWRKICLRSSLTHEEAFTELMIKIDDMEKKWCE
jgi:hypothetical protein